MRSAGVNKIFAEDFLHPDSNPIKNTRVHVKTFHRLPRVWGALSLEAVDPGFDDTPHPHMSVSAAVRRADRRI